MEITTGPIEWDVAEDREILAAFLKTRTGARLLPKVVESCPTLLSAGDTNSVLIRNGEVLGFQKAIQALVALAQVEQTLNEVAPPSMPSLTDDAAWDDGQKLSINSTKK